MTITSHHGRAREVQEMFGSIAQFFSELKSIAPQLTPLEQWSRILSKVVEKILPQGVWDHRPYPAALAST